MKKKTATSKSLNNSNLCYCNKCYTERQTIRIRRLKRYNSALWDTNDTSIGDNPEMVLLF